MRQPARNHNDSVVRRKSSLNRTRDMAVRDCGRANPSINPKSIELRMDGCVDNVDVDTYFLSCPCPAYNLHQVFMLVYASKLPGPWSRWTAILVVVSQTALNQEAVVIAHNVRPRQNLSFHSVPSLEIDQRLAQMSEFMEDTKEVKGMAEQWASRRTLEQDTVDRTICFSRLTATLDPTSFCLLPLLSPSRCSVFESTTAVAITGTQRFRQC